LSHHPNARIIKLFCNPIIHRHLESKNMKEKDNNIESSTISTKGPRLRNIQTELPEMHTR
jgi:hypothetical protein